MPEASLKSILRKFASDCGFKYFAYVILRGMEGSWISNFPQEWQRKYLEKNFSRFDPVITNAKRAPCMYNWVACPPHSGDMTGDVLEFYENASEFGIKSGFSVAIPTGFGHHAILTLASDHMKTSTINPTHTQLAIIATAMIYKSFSSNEALSKEIDLTPREATCLRWIAEGKSTQDVADLLGISYRSVRFYLDEAKRKLSTHSTVQAVALASRMHLI